jgi:alanine dehydrogenase
MPILIPNDAAKNLITVADAIEPMTEVMKDLAAGRAANGARYRLPTPGGFMQWGPATWLAADRMGYKVWANSGSPLSGAWIYLYEMSTGRLLAVLEAHHTSWTRTSAISLVAARAALPDPTEPVTVAVYGSGRQARGQVEAFAVGFPVKEFRVYSRGKRGREEFGRFIEEKHGVSAVPVSRPEDATPGAQLILTATSASEPVVKGAWLDDPQAILAMGANRIYERELDAEAVEKMATIIVDDMDEAKTCCGDLLYMVEKGRLTWHSVLELGDVLRANQPRPAPVLFESQGLSITDIAIAERTYQAALASGLHFDEIALT